MLRVSTIYDCRQPVANEMGTGGGCEAVVFQTVGKLQLNAARAQENSVLPKFTSYNTTRVLDMLLSLSYLSFFVCDAIIRTSIGGHWRMSWYP